MKKLNRFVESLNDGFPALPGDWHVTLSPEQTRSKRTKRVDAAPTKDLLALFDFEHERAFQTKANFQSARDATLLAKLWRERQGDSISVEDLIRAFFERRDVWVVRMGYSVPIFIGQVPGLIQWILRRRPRRAVKDEPDWRDECQTLHNGRCRSRYVHAQFMAPDVSEDES